jgi:thioredoxin 1
LPVGVATGDEEMSLQQLNATDFDDVVYEKGGPCLVVFSRKDCHVCKKVVPALQELQSRYEGRFGFYHVDIEESASLFRRFSLKGVPQILYFDRGQFKGKQVGLVGDDEVEEKITGILEV